MMSEVGVMVKCLQSALSTWCFGVRVCVFCCNGEVKPAHVSKLWKLPHTAMTL